MNEPIRPEDLRVSDAERHHAQEVLHRAHGIGQLDLYEFDERVTAVWASRTRGDLHRLVADLPPPPPDPPHPARRTVFSRTPAGVAMQVLTVIWASIAATNVVLWGLVSTTFGIAYPWWLWVAGPPAAVLMVLYIAGVGRPSRP